MKKESVLLVVSCLMVLSLLLASCAPAAPTAPTTPTAPTGPEVPKYGGTFTFISGRGWSGNFDHVFRGGRETVNPSVAQGFDEMLEPDYSKGPGGTKETSLLTWTNQYHVMKGSLAESWEIVDDVTFIYYLRKGVHWWDKAPVNGRELVADDIIFSIKRKAETPGGYWETRMLPEELPVSLRAIDKYTVEVKAHQGYLQPLFEWTAVYNAIQPPEVIEEYGDMRNWETHVGTGPFMMVDYIEESSITLARNPNYWMKDYFGPGEGNQLPYLDAVKILMVKDSSTRLAALRTAKTDWLDRISWEDAAVIKQTRKDMEERSYPSGSIEIYMRTDKPEQPWYDINVRRALQMAINEEEIVRDYLGGRGLALNWPEQDWADGLPRYTPLEEQSEIVQKMFSYRPEEAKQLLAEAGYPDGFKMGVLTLAANVDQLSIIKDYWSKIGVDLDIQVKEKGVFASIEQGRTHTDAMARDGGLNGTPYAWHPFNPDDALNLSMIDDSYANDTYQQVVDIYFFEREKADAIVKEFYKYAVEQAWVIQLPMAHQSIMWEPWVKNYHGEWIVAYVRPQNFTKFIWIDQELKKSMGF